MATTTNLQDCAMCGREASRLFDGDHCAVCRLSYLSGSADGACMAHRMIVAMITNAVVYEGLDPNDVRETVEEALGYAAKHAGTGQGRLAEISHELEAHKNLLRAEVA